MNDLTDVTTTPIDGDTLCYNATSGLWENVPKAGNFCGLRVRQAQVFNTPEGFTLLQYDDLDYNIGLTFNGVGGVTIPAGKEGYYHITASWSTSSTSVPLRTTIFIRVTDSLGLRGIAWHDGNAHNVADDKNSVQTSTDYFLEPNALVEVGYIMNNPAGTIVTGNNVGGNGEYNVFSLHRIGS